MLRASCLHCERNDRVLFSNLTFEIKPKSLLKITGPNGSGKSSLLRMIAGLSLLPSQSNIIWQEQAIQTVLFIAHQTGILSGLTPKENLRWWLEVESNQKEIQKYEINHLIERALQTVGLQNFQDMPSDLLSCGQKQRLSLSRLWCHTGKLWILDEPFSALDKVGQEVVEEQLFQHVKKEGALIITGHHSNQKDFFLRMAETCDYQEISLGQWSCQ